MLLKRHYKHDAPKDDWGTVPTVPEELRRLSTRIAEASVSMPAVQAMTQSIPVGADHSSDPPLVVHFGVLKSLMHDDPLPAEILTQELVDALFTQRRIAKLVPPLDYVTIKHTGVHAEQTFSTKWIAQGMREKWLTLGDATITLHAHQQDLQYTILRMPGAYCCHCGQKLPSGGQVAQAHVEMEHMGVESPDKENPSGYKVINAYECVLDAAQQAKWRVPAGSTVAHYRGE